MARAPRKTAAKPLDPHEPVTEAERGLLEAVDGDGTFDARDLDQPDRVVRPTFLRAMLLRKIKGKTVPETGLRTLGLTFESELKMEHGSIDSGPLPPIHLRYADFHHGANFEGAYLSHLDLHGSSSKRPINLNRSRILGDAWFDQLELDGGLLLMGAEIGGDLSLNGAILKGSIDDKNRIAGYALSADGVRIRGGIFCRLSDGRRFQAEGMFRLLSAQIGGDLTLNGACLKGTLNKEGIVTGFALAADKAVIQGSVFFSTAEKQRFQAEGSVRLIGAKIEGILSLRGADISAQHSSALNAERTSVMDVTFLDDNFNCRGSINFRGATLSDLEAQGTTDVSSPTKIVIDMRDATIRRLGIRGIKGVGKINLEGASADTFDGFFPGRWGTPPSATEGLELDLDGFVYRRAEFSRAKPPIRTRKWAAFKRWDTHAISENVLDLLDREFRHDRPDRVHYMPQPFEQAARALREAGYDREANAVAVAKREFKRRSRADGKLAAGISWLSCLFFRHGYGPMRASLWMIAFVLLGGGAVWVAQAADLLVTVPAAGQAATRCAEVPLGFALDAFLPLVDLGIDKQCEVSTTRPGWWAAESARIIYAILGWLFVPMVALTYAGVLRKD